MPSGSGHKDTDDDLDDDDLGDEAFDHVEEDVDVEKLVMAMSVAFCPPEGLLLVDGPVFPGDEIALGRWPADD